MDDMFSLYFGVAVISIPTYLLIAVIQFGSLTKLWDCVGDWVSGDRYSAGRSWADLKLIYFVCLCAGAVYGESVLLLKFLPGVARAIQACAQWVIPLGR